MASRSLSKTFRNPNFSGFANKTKNGNSLLAPRFTKANYGKQGFIHKFGVASTFSNPETFEMYKYALLGCAVSVVLYENTKEPVYAADADWDSIKKDIESILDNDRYDDGSFGPVLVRLAWHASGTYDKATNSYGSNGATMRFKPEAEHGANAGLHIARNLLEQIKKKHPEISYADLYTYAGAVAIEAMGGPKIAWRPGRTDAPDGESCPPDGNLPDAAQGAPHVRDIFYRMGFNDQEIVALVGAHAVGRCHRDRSGYDGPWTKAPTMFSNEFFRELVDNTWEIKKWDGPLQFEDSSKELMMLPADMALLRDPKFKVWVQKYAADEELFFRDFQKAFSKLLELGVPSFEKAWWQFWK